MNCANHDVPFLRSAMWSLVADIQPSRLCYEEKEVFLSVFGSLTGGFPSASRQVRRPSAGEETTERAGGVRAKTVNCSDRHR